METPARSVRIPATIWNAAKERADQEGTSVSAVILRALTRYAKGGRMTLYQLLVERGIDRDRLARALDTQEDWGNMVHAFEYLTVLGTVLSCWPADVEVGP